MTSLLCGNGLWWVSELSCRRKVRIRGMGGGGGGGGVRGVLLRWHKLPAGLAGIPHTLI